MTKPYTSKEMQDKCKFCWECEGPAEEIHFDPNTGEIVGVLCDVCRKNLDWLIKEYGKYFRD